MKDSYGDALTVYTRPPGHMDEPVAVTVNADQEDTDERTVTLSREAVAGLR